MTSFGQDVRYALRTLRRSPGFTVVAVLTLALGIGANAAIFSAVHAVLLRPLPFADADRVLLIQSIHTERGGPSVSLPDFEDWEKDSPVFQRMAALSGWTFNLTGREFPERVFGARVTPAFFDVLGTPALLGRTLNAADHDPANPEAIVLSHGLWQRSFGGDEQVVGRVLTLNGRPHTVVGVMPPRFAFPDRGTELWGGIRDNMGGIPRNARFLIAVGRLKDGVSREQAQAAIIAHAAQLEREYPQTNSGWGARLLPVRERLAGNVRPALLLLLGATGLVLLIACLNVANLLLAQASGRQRECAIRAALGAGPRRLTRQFLTESLVLALSGGALGVGMAYGGIALLRAYGPSDALPLDEITLDASVLGFTLGVTLLTSFFFGLMPALHVARANVNDVLKEAGRDAQGGRGGRRWRNALVVAEVALAVTLLVGGGLLMRSLSELLDVSPGFEPDRVVTMNIFLGPPKYRQPADVREYIRRALEAVEPVAGVESAAAVSQPPFSGQGSSLDILPEGWTTPPDGAPRVFYRSVSPGYAQTMGIPLRRGRHLEETDTESTPFVVLINESMARQMWPNDDPIGKRFRFTDPARDVGWVTVVGVVGDVKTNGLDKPDLPALYASYRQLQIPWLRWTTFTVRTRTSPGPVVQTLRREMQAVDPDQPIFGITTMQDSIAASTAQRRFLTSLLGAFAALAMTLAAVGLYGVMAYTVAQRTHEIGLRMALGAQTGDVLRLVLRRGLALTLAGVSLGLAGAAAASRVLEGMLFGVAGTDPLTYVAVCAVLLVVALAACWVPARRALRVEPLIALRNE